MAEARNPWGCERCGKAHDRLNGTDGWHCGCDCHLTDERGRIPDHPFLHGPSANIIDWAKPTKMMEVTPNREVVFFSPEGLETWRCSFDALSEVLRGLVEYPPTIVGEPDG